MINLQIKQIVVGKKNDVYYVKTTISVQYFINNSFPICHSQTCRRQKSHCITLGIHVCRKHNFLYFSLAELNLYSGPQFHQVAETQSQSALTDSPPRLCPQNARWGAIWPSVSSALPTGTPRGFLLSVWSLATGPCRWPPQPPCPHSKDTLSLLGLCVFFTGEILLLLYCSRLRKTL